MSDQTLMQSIKAGWGTAIVHACVNSGSTLPPAFLAALIAGESGGKNDAKRFEPAVLTKLWEVILGRKAAYGSIGRADLVAFIAGVFPAPAASTPLPPDAFQRVDSLATSWGLTQIMGYHGLDSGLATSVYGLRTPDVNLGVAVKMLRQFASGYALDTSKDFPELFRCWNTGQPAGATFDPNYVPNGINRMAVWDALP